MSVLSPNLDDLQQLAFSDVHAANISIIERQDSVIFVENNQKNSEDDKPAALMRTQSLGQIIQNLDQTLVRLTTR